MSASKPKTSWQKTRKLLNDIHLWLGLIGGIVIFLICLSGTIYTFSSEIQEALEPQLYRTDAAPGAQRLPEEQLVKLVEKHAGGKAVSMTVPDDANRLISVGIRKKGAKGRPSNYQIDPYSGEVKGIAGKGKGSEFFSTMFKLHRWLLLETDTGRPIVGIATIMFTFGCLTGLVIWFPQKVKNWRQGLKIKMKGNWKRTNHDLHNSLGFYSFILLLVMSLTGLCWSFEWYRDGLSQVMGAQVFGGRDDKAPEVAFSENATRLPLSEIIKSGQGTITYKGDLRINFPKEPTESIVLTKSKKGFITSAGTDKLYLDPYTGAALQLERFSDKPLNVQVAQSIRSLHTGDIFGTFSKVIYFIGCLIATSLPVTGILIWWNKLKKKRKRKSKGKDINKREMAAAS